MTEPQVFKAIWCSPEEYERLLSAWKHSKKGTADCNQFIKAAINAYTGKKIFDLKKEDAE